MGLMQELKRRDLCPTVSIHALSSQGGLLVDGFAVFLSGATGTAPSVSYCMNGFIAISRVASRGSGMSAAH